MSVTRLTSSDNATSGTTSTTASVTLSGRPVFIVLASPATSGAANWGTVTWNGGSQNFDGVLVTGSANGTNDCNARIVYLDAPTPGTGTITINHANTTTRRSWDLFELDAGTYDTSSPSAWRDAAAAAVEQAGGSDTTHEVVVTSAVGDYPFAAVVLRNVTSAPTLSLNGSSSDIAAGHLSGTTLRTSCVTGTGAASITLGGTTATGTQSVILGFNINQAVATAPRLAGLAGGLHDFLGGLQQ